MSSTLESPLSMEQVVTVESAPMVWSASRLKKYLTCPRQFQYCYIDGLAAVPGAPLVLGRVLHETILYLHEEQMITSQLPPLLQILEEFDSLWRRALQVDDPFFRSGGPSAEQSATAGREMLRLYHHEQKGQPPPLLVEMPFEVMAGDYRICGIIDRIDMGRTGLIVTDFKSGRKAAVGEIERDLQLTLYAYAAEQVLAVPVEAVAWHFLKDGTVSRETRTPETCADLIENLLPHVAMAVERGEFELRPGYWCRFCDYRELCRAENPVPVPTDSVLPSPVSLGAVATSETKGEENDGDSNSGDD